MILEGRVRDIAKRGLITIDEESSILSASELMVKHDVGSLVVTRAGEPIGIITERDLLRKVLATGKDPRTMLVKEAMTSPLITVEADKTIREAIELMNVKKIRRLLVTEGGRVIGIFTQRDVLSLNRLCPYCSGEIRPALESLGLGEPYVECECGGRYHINCAKTVVHCVLCSRTVVTDVIYPEPSETMSG